jgi:hypothetical protein
VPLSTACHPPLTPSRFTHAAALAPACYAVKHLGLTPRLALLRISSHAYYRAFAVRFRSRVHGLRDSRCSFVHFLRCYRCPLPTELDLHGNVTLFCRHFMCTVLRALRCTRRCSCARTLPDAFYRTRTLRFVRLDCWFCQHPVRRFLCFALTPRTVRSG